MSKYKRHFRKRKYDRRNRHHLIPVSRMLGNFNCLANKLLIDIEKHKCWHIIFKNLTLDEVIKLLQRIQRMRGLYEQTN